MVGSWLLAFLTDKHFTTKLVKSLNTKRNVRVLSYRKSFDQVYIYVFYLENNWGWFYNEDSSIDVLL